MKKSCRTYQFATLYKFRDLMQRSSSNPVGFNWTRLARIILDKRIEPRFKSNKGQRN
ncbi:MAG: hypothetical protein ACFFCS_15460 [Candidatus Hodarchaeota archaeon]